MLKHHNEFHKVAICAHKQWQHITAKLGSWFVSGDVKFFNNKDEALAWLLGD
ncbi:MAG: STAS/SEC14 domain-containing protein [Ghiorsea sp.]|nr:STAS/SEC14 domain-containing protein [Ghiorsea sp.]